MVCVNGGGIMHHAERPGGAVAVRGGLGVHHGRRDRTSGAGGPSDRLSDLLLLASGVRPGYLTRPFCIAGFAIYWAGLSGGVSRLCFLLVQSGQGRVAGFGKGLASLNLGMREVSPAGTSWPFSVVADRRGRHAAAQASGSLPVSAPSVRREPANDDAPEDRIGLRVTARW